MKKINFTIILIIILAVIVGGIYWFSSSMQNQQSPAGQNQQNQTMSEQNQNQTQQALSAYEIQGMKVEILQEGTGQVTQVGDTVTVNYVGTLEDGTKFDSSIDRGETFSFTLGENRVIQGWELGVLGMKVGEKRKLTIPADLAYGNQAVGDIIPANATLIFEVELVGISQ